MHAPCLTLEVSFFAIQGSSAGEARPRRPQHSFYSCRLLRPSEAEEALIRRMALAAVVPCAQLVYASEPTRALSPPSNMRVRIDTRLTVSRLTSFRLASPDLA